MGASQSKVLRPRTLLERLQPQIFNVLRNGFFVDKLYEATIIRFNALVRTFLRLAGPMGLGRRSTARDLSGGMALRIEPLGRCIRSESGL